MRDAISDFDATARLDNAPAIRDVRAATASALRRLGVMLLQPLVAIVVLLEWRAGRIDAPILVELAGSVAAATWMVGPGRHASPRTVGVVGLGMLLLISVTSQAHFGLTAGVASGWMLSAIVAHILFGWRASTGAVLALLASSGTQALLLAAGTWGGPAASIGGPTTLSVVLRLTLVVGVVMIGVAVGTAIVFGQLTATTAREREAQARLHQTEMDRSAAQAAAEAAQRLESMGHLASGIVHDVNNALTVVMGNTELLPLVGPEEAEGLRMQIVDAVTAASRTTSQLKTLASGLVQRGEMATLSATVRDLEDVFRRLLPEDISLRVASTAVRETIVDRSLLQQALLNLVVNARDAMPGGGSIGITVRDVDGPDGVVLSVADTGKGMDEATRARAFEPFFTTKGHERGTGLGLPMVKHFAESCGGRVEIVSRVGQGTLVQIRFPGATTSPGSSPDDPEGAGTQEPGLESRLAGRPVLVAEDDEDIRRLITAFLRSIQAEVVGVGDAATARAEIERRPFDLFVTDAVMPGGGTAEAISLFRSRNPDGSVLVVSGHVEEALLRRGIETGNVPYLAKPFDREQLHRAVTRSFDAGPADSV